MKKLLLSVALSVASLNLVYLLIAHFFPQLHYDGLVLIIDAAFITALAIMHYQREQDDDDDDNAKQVILQAKDSTEHNLFDPSLLHINIQALVQHFPNILCIKDKEGRWLAATDDYLSLFNLQKVDYMGKTDFDFANETPDKVEEFRASVAQDNKAWLSKQQVVEIKRLKRAESKKTEILQITRIPVFDSHHHKLNLIITGQPISETEKTTMQVQRMGDVFDLCHLSFVFLNEKFNITGVNLPFSLLTGYKANEVEGKHLSCIIDGQLNLSYSDFFKIKHKQLWSGELRCKHKNGHIFPLKVDITAITKENQPVVYFASLFDITQQKQAEKRIMQIAHYDDLTGLANRVMFFDRLSRFVSASTSHSLHAIVLIVDLDRFKAINDSLGHDAGDELLKEVAKRLLTIVKKGDIVARLSGDEFAVLLTEKSHDQVTYIASLLAGNIMQQLAAAFSIKLAQGTREVFIGSSIGIAFYPDDGETAEQLLKNADVAMYEAKNQGRNNYQFYRKDYTVAAQDRIVLEGNLRKAIGRGELQLYYQPQYYADTRELCGAEVLIRWLHGQKMIPPYYFIGIAEETGLIIEIGQWILRTACQRIKLWLNEGYPLQQVSVNVSARQFTDPNFIQIVQDVLTETNLDPKHLELELTESMLVGDIKRIELQLQRLKKMGIKIALDDFGTGYSSLSYLKNFPIDMLKIDQSFVRELTAGSKDARIASAIIDMGHSLGQKIIAEGVETEEQLLYLTHRGCDIIQGYYFSQPIPTDKMTALLRAEADGSGLGAVSKKKGKASFE